MFITLVRFSVISIKEKLKHNYLKYVFEDYLTQKMKEFQGIRKCITHISLPNDNKNKSAALLINNREIELKIKSTEIYCVVVNKKDKKIECIEIKTTL